jgi:fumarate hydratase class II
VVVYVVARDRFRAARAYFLGRAIVEPPRIDAANSNGFSFRRESFAVNTFRTEKDSMGSLNVPADAYYGAQTRRAELNFQISSLRAPRALIRALGLIKKSAAQVNMDLGLLPEELGVAITRAAQGVAEGKFDDQFVVDVFQTGSGTSTNMNTNEVIAGIANEALAGTRGGKSPVHPNDAVNMGQSSNDVYPTAIHVAALEGLKKNLIPAFSRLRDALTTKAKEFDSIVKIGRTHLQDAVPIRLGQEFSGFAGQIEHAIKRLEACCDSLSELAIGGTAVGTGINTHAEFPERMTALLSQETGLSFRPASNTFEAMANRDAAVMTSAMLKAAAVSLSNVANNIRWLSSGPRCGIGEIQIPELQPGSSIMPGKVNPVIPEAVMMVAAQVVGADATIAWSNALGSNFQLNVMMPVIAYNLLQSIDLLAAAAGHLNTKCLDAREFFASKEIKPPGVDRVLADTRAADSIERSLAMCTALAPRIGYDNAAAIAKAAFKGRIGGKTLVREVALELVGKTPEAVAALLFPDDSDAKARSQAVELLVSKGGYPAAAEIDRLLDPMSQTIRGVGVGSSGGG